MPSSRRGKTHTLSISVDETTDRILKEEAAAHFGGNVSKLVAAIAREARRKAAVDWIAVWSGYTKLTAEERDRIEAGIQEELAGQTRRRKRKSSAA
jgi:hypothetical protein